MKRSLLLFFLFGFSFLFCYSQNPGEWMWINGSVSGYSGSYGIQGIPSPTNKPPYVYEACEWTDLQGNFWLYGGVGTGTLSDLWKYDPSTNEWTWMTGTNTANDSGNYGIRGVPSPNNRPPSKGWGTLSWVDTSSNLWMYGGEGQSEYCDLWKYDINTNIWTWISGSNIPLQDPVFGIKGIPDSSNSPGTRFEVSSAWTDTANNLWFYGGYSVINNNPGLMNDVWRYNILSNKWTWMKGENTLNPQGYYGIKGVESAFNSPGSRGCYGRWTDKEGNFWIFGGFPFGGIKNDLWRFNPTTNNWTWMTGDSVGNSRGLYGTQCSPSKSNSPHSRRENRAAWTDDNGNFWMFGGLAYSSDLNDLWMYCVATNKWSLISGDSINPVGNYGSMGVSSPTNKPAPDAGIVGWYDHNGHLYLFSGNVLWKYAIDPCCNACSHSFIASETTFCSEPLKCINFFDESGCNPTSWQWSFPGANPSSSNLQNPTNVCYSTPGTFPVTLIVTNLAGSDTLTISPMITVGGTPPPPTINVAGDTLFSSHASTYQWYLNGNVIGGATDSFYVAIQGGLYAVMITDSVGCSRLSGGVGVGVDEINNGEGIKIYPNPVENAFTVYGLQFTVHTTIEIFNVLGERVYSEPFDSKQKTVNCQFPSGVYFVHIENEKLNWVGKVVKE